MTALGQDRFDGDAVLRKVRVVAILAATPSVGLAPLPATQLHTIAYFADALAPVWDLRILDEQLLKRTGGPLSPALQTDIDELVGRGVLVPHHLKHILDSDKRWRLDASYSLNYEFADRILAATVKLSAQNAHLDFIREVVYALSRLGMLRIASASQEDASYGDPSVAPETMVDIEEEDGVPNASARVALRFADLALPNITLADAEMVHLYIHELYERLGRAA